MTSDMYLQAKTYIFALTVGDPSSSQSERWEVHFTNDQTGITRHHCDQGYGTPKTDFYSFVKGRTYTFTVVWTGTNRGDPGPDYDYQFLIDGSDSPGVRLDSFGGAYIIEDPDQLLTHLTDGGPVNPTLGRVMKLIVPKNSVEFIVGASASPTNDLQIGT